jgi:hypothetical protein
LDSHDKLDYLQLQEAEYCTERLYRASQRPNKRVVSIPGTDRPALVSIPGTDRQANATAVSEPFFL